MFSSKMHSRIAKLESVCKSLDSITTFLKPALFFLNSHTVDYFTKELWNKNLPERLRQDLESLPVSMKLLENHVNNLIIGAWKSEVLEDPEVSFTNCTLNELVARIGQLLLPNLKMSIPVTELPFLRGLNDSHNVLSLGLSENELKFDSFMSRKKMHEVEVMAGFISKVTEVSGSSSCELNDFPCSSSEADLGECSSGTHIEHLVDLGSGKGYLSSFLALLYKYNVLAIDSSSVNTTGSAQRSAKLQKVWSSLIRRAMERQASGEFPKRGKNWKSKSNKTQAEPTSAPSEICIDGDEPYEGLRNQTLFVTQEMNLKELLLQNFPKSAATGADDPNFGIIGLHTCGSLGVDSLRLFLSNPKCRFVCNVPCCYHHLEEPVFHPSAPITELLSYVPKTLSRNEEFWAKEDEASTPNPTFPLSSHLRGQEFNLGRNARMLSSYSLQRVSHEMKESGEIDRALLWRLLFQVILQEKQGHTLLEYHVGHLGRKCSSFQEYVRKALVKVHLPHLEISDAEIESVYQRYQPDVERFRCYYRLRTMMAPLIEGCILLDRLAFLLEQDLVEQAHIVQLFDPFLSPRCNLILALK